MVLISSGRYRDCLVVLISSDTHWYSGEWHLHVSLVPVTDRLETVVSVTDFLW